MKPIIYDLRKEHNFISDEKLIIDNEWEEKEFYNYQPEWFENVYNGVNKYHLATHNSQLQYYMNHKNEYTYLATWKHIDKLQENYVEYYFIDDNTLIAYYSEKYKKDNRYLGAIMVFTKKEVARQ